MELNPVGNDSQGMFPRAQYWGPFCLFLINNLDKALDCILGKFADNTKLGRRVGLLEGRKAPQILKRLSDYRLQVVVGHWSRLPWEVVESPAVKVFERDVDVALRDRV